MRRVCTKCSGIFDAHFLCPTCGVQLRDPSAEETEAGTVAQPALPDEVLNTPVWQRFFAGLALGIGLSFAFREIGTAYMMAVGIGDWWSTEPGHIAALALQAIAILCGSLVAAAGRERGSIIGAAIGLMCSAGLILAPYAMQKPIPTWILFGSPAPLLLLGLIGGFIGARIWPPLSRFRSPRGAGSVVIAKAPPAEAIPIQFFRIIAGAALAVGCAVWAADIRDAVVTFGAGQLGITSNVQARFISWIIAAIAAVIGGVFAGATTRGGGRHGFLAGLAASAGVFIIHLYVVREPLSAAEFLAEVLDLEFVALSPSQTALFLLTNTLPLAFFGGWVGGVLFPRLLIGANGRRLDRGAI